MKESAIQRNCDGWACCGKRMIYHYSLRFRLLILLCLYSGLVDADLTGIGVKIGDSKSDWKFDGGVREARGTELSVRFEEKVESGLRIGADLGLINLRVDGSASSSSHSFDVQYFGLNLRQPFPISETSALFIGVNYRFYSGEDSDGRSRADITWSELEFHFGTSLKLSTLKISPLVIYQAVDGDMDGDDSSEDFELDDPVSAGIRFDFFTDATAFVRLEFLSGSREGVFFSFAREY